jgi:hypothetical protein
VATIYRKQALAEVGGFREPLGYWTDTFALRAIALKHGACYVPMRCAAFRDMGNSFAHRSRRDMKCTLNIVDRMAWLMRSPGFRDRFPEEYTARWHRDIRRVLIAEHVQRLHDALSAYHGTFYKGIIHESFLNKVLGSVFSRTHNLHKAMASAFLRFSLNRYRGDLAPVLPAEQTSTGEPVLMNGSNGRVHIGAELQSGD